MALDEPTDQDEVFDDRGLNYIVEKELLERIKPIKIDYTHSAYGAGFSISSSMEMGNACGSCTSC